MKNKRRPAHGPAQKWREGGRGLSAGSFGTNISHQTQIFEK